jgi:hypothetical protein
VEVTHETLFRKWNGLKKWLDANREALRIRARLWALADRWIAKGKRRKYLCPVGQLEEAEHVFKSKQLTFDDDEVNYMAASRRSLWVRRGILATVPALVISFLGILSWNATSNAGRRWPHP